MKILALFFLLSTFSHVCRGVLNPIDATIGGIVAQEVMKACSKKGNPIVQWFYFDASDCLPENCDLTEEQCKSTGSRYDGQVQSLFFYFYISVVLSIDFVVWETVILTLEKSISDLKF